MLRILHLDASARAGRSDRQAHGSHTRRLSARFVERWRALRSEDSVVYRDIGASPPSPVSGDWIHAAFTPPARREPWMQAVLAESDRLVDELVASDLIVAGVPMYNFGMPAQFKAYLDNVVRVGRTFGFDRERPGDPYWPMLAGQGKRLVILSARGDFGYAPGQRLAHTNHVEGGVATPLQYLGIDLAASVAVEYDEFADERLAESLRRAEDEVDRWVRVLAEEATTAPACA
jgi:FMN-dependent NADH-azoreductase